jgi:hypothetical protein
MSRRLRAALAFTALTALAAVPLAAQAQTNPVAVAKGYKAPRTPFGQPDLQGIWTNRTITPLTRPAKFGDRLVLTPEEAKALEDATAAQVARADAPTPPDLKVTDLKNADCGADGISGFNCGYNQGWKDPGDRVVRINGEPRSSIITSNNGQFPPVTQKAQERRRAAMAANPQRGNYDGPEARALGERCILSFGSAAGPPMLPLMYNNNYHIVQTPDAVVIEVEMVHDTRVVRLNSKHDTTVKKWMGDTIGWWEGDTLVMETKGLRPEQSFRGSGPNLRVIEKLTRISPKQILYQFELHDPDTWAEPVKGELSLNPAKGLLYEYACHEGNYAMEGILAGARLAEKEGRPVEGNRGRVLDEGGN